MVIHIRMMKTIMIERENNDKNNDEKIGMRFCDEYSSKNGSKDGC